MTTRLHELLKVKHMTEHVFLNWYFSIMFFLVMQGNASMSKKTFMECTWLTGIWAMTTILQFLFYEHHYGVESVQRSYELLWTLSIHVDIIPSVLWLLKRLQIVFNSDYNIKQSVKHLNGIYRRFVLHKPIIEPKTRINTVPTFYSSDRELQERHILVNVMVKNQPWIWVPFSLSINLHSAAWVADWFLKDIATF